MKERASGILLHITSLPGPFGVGDFGPEAYRFIDFLFQSKQTYWQILPLNPVDSAFGNSPYTSTSAFAGSVLFLSPELLVRDGYLGSSDIHPVPEFARTRVDYKAAMRYKKGILRKTFARGRDAIHSKAFAEFCAVNSAWLEDFALFAVLKDFYRQKIWTEWAPDIRDRRPEEIDRLRVRLESRIDLEKFLQYLLWDQWFRLRSYARNRGVMILGDMPIYVVHDSADVWLHPDFFWLDGDKEPCVVAGVPPDYFSETGQLWGNPLYRWEVLREQGYEWWFQRLAHNFRICDRLRIDHFRGFFGYWEIPASERNAVKGKWVQAPGLDFFSRVKKKFSDLPIIAEDLGVITPDVTEGMERLGIPGMKVILFAFEDDNPVNPYLPHTYGKNCVVYTGTHDNNTVRGWFENEADDRTKKRVFHYLGHDVSLNDVHKEFIRLALMSAADTAILPMQDLLGLGEEARMNRPAISRGNWEWRLLPEQLTPQLATWLSDAAGKSGRISSISP